MKLSKKFRKKVKNDTPGRIRTPNLMVHSTLLRYGFIRLKQRNVYITLCIDREGLYLLDWNKASLPTAFTHSLTHKETRSILQYAHSLPTLPTLRQLQASHVHQLDKLDVIYLITLYKFFKYTS